jgi:hypothetical protein
LKWKDVIRVRDACLEAGFREIRFAPPPQAGG